MNNMIPDNIVDSKKSSDVNFNIYDVFFHPTKSRQPLLKGISLEFFGDVCPLSKRLSTGPGSHIYYICICTLCGIYQDTWN